MSWEIRIGKSRDKDINEFDIMNALVEAIPDVSFLNIAPPFLLMGLQDRSLRGVILQDEGDYWQLMVQGFASHGDYELFQRVIQAMSQKFDAPLFVPEYDSDASFDDEDEFSDDEDDDFDGEGDDFDDDDDDDDLDGEDEVDEFDDGLEKYADMDFDEFLDTSTQSVFDRLLSGDLDFESSEDDVTYREVEYDEIASAYFGEGWIDDAIAVDLGSLRSMVRFTGTSINCQGIFHTFCIGPWLMKKFGISVEPSGPASEGRNMLESEARGAVSLMDYLTRLQWKYRNVADTSTDLRAVDPSIHPEVISGDFDAEKIDEHPDTYSKTISSISSERMQKGDFPLLVSYAHLMQFIKSDEPAGHDTLMMNFENVHRFMPTHRIDELQMVIERPMTDDEVEECLGQVPLFVARDIFETPEWPGQGYSRVQNTYIMMWNPEISSFSMKDFREAIANMRTVSINWSIHDHRGARIGDRFFLVCCGGENRGMVMSGLLASNPWRGDDWSGRGREVWYVDLAPNVMIDPDNGEPLSIEELQFEIPTFDWTGGHSGRLLAAEAARELCALWKKHYQEWETAADGRTVNVIYRTTF